MVNFLVIAPNVTKIDKRDAQTEISVINYSDIHSADIARKVPPCSLSTGISVFHDTNALSSSRKLNTQISVDLDETAEIWHDNFNTFNALLKFAFSENIDRVCTS